MNNPPEFDFENSRPRSVDIPFNQYLAWIEAHAGDIIFSAAVKEGHYRVSWKPGAHVLKKTVDTPSLV